jgi:serine/threonine protein phosphatase PrpC
METNVAAYSLQGRHHPLNEDRYRLLGGSVPLVSRTDAGHLFAVVDGVGDAPRGRDAAAWVVDHLARFFSDPFEKSPRGLLELLMELNREIHAWGMMEGTQRPLGAAASTVAWFAPGKLLHTMHVGDTVAIKHDGERLTLLTQAHSSGLGLTRYMGAGPELRFHVSSVDFEPGDVLLLVSDGVTPKGMDLGTLGTIVQEYYAERFPFDRLAQVVVERARARGSGDDITCLAVELEEW